MPQMRLTGRHFHVLEQSASRTLKVGDLMFTRVITAGGASILIGACPWVIPASWQIPIIDMREAPPEGATQAEELLDYDPEIRQAYHELRLAQAMNASNASGEVEERPE